MQTTAGQVSRGARRNSKGTTSVTGQNIAAQAEGTNPSESDTGAQRPISLKRSGILPSLDTTPRFSTEITLFPWIMLLVK